MQVVPPLRSFVHNRRFDLTLIIPCLDSRPCAHIIISLGSPMAAPQHSVLRPSTPPPPDMSTSSQMNYLTQDQVDQVNDDWLAPSDEIWLTEYEQYSSRVKGKFVHNAVGHGAPLRKDVCDAALLLYLASSTRKTSRTCSLAPRRSSESGIPPPIRLSPG